MANSPVAMITESYNQTHRQMLDFLRKLSNEQLHWRLTPENHSIAFHAWHVGRWADHFQASVPGMTAELAQRLEPGVEIWEAENLADRWGFSTSQLGYAGTGMTMPDEIAMRLPFPAKDELLGYLEKVFAASERAVSAIDEQQFQSAELPQPRTQGIWGQATVGDALMSHVTHANRHLGMMECLLGFQGQPGTATR